MAHVWQIEQGAWAPTPLDGDEYELLPSLRPRAATAGVGGEATGVILRRLSPGSAEELWVLRAHGHERVRVNGELLHQGLRVLRHRDEVWLGGETTIYFATDRPAAVEPYPGGATTANCPRCRQELKPGQPAVCCPRCRVWHHQSEQTLPCWTYAERCALCEQSTALGGEFTFVPA